ncbi:hypothetical protein SAMN05421874_109197 [Nonomuraea maritima]|uniref:MBL fold metallo-hydrolase n=1 Tax=Nonomuraea maritima TaxID=683260 RepID=A0A1G9DM44_9ACTN|nr:hypothetical protein [Nonomuraea maritima]SDK64951.1 hypothetical protein SAMN05421874_109197 [Nonomuraea maritima]
MPTIEPLSRQDGAATVLGGPTTVIDLGGLRILVDPTFDDPGPHGYQVRPQCSGLQAGGEADPPA